MHLVYFKYNKDLTCFEIELEYRHFLSKMYCGLCINDTSLVKKEYWLELVSNFFKIIILKGETSFQQQFVNKLMLFLSITAKLTYCSR